MIYGLHLIKAITKTRKIKKILRESLTYFRHRKDMVRFAFSRLPWLQHPEWTGEGITLVTGNETHNLTVLVVIVREERQQSGGLWGHWGEGRWFRQTRGEHA